MNVNMKVRLSQLQVYLFVIILLLPTLSKAQVYCTAQDKQKCESYLSRLEKMDLQGKTAGEIAIEVGKMMMGTPYVAHTLELDGPEQLVVNFTGLDCTTFLENVVVMSRLRMKDSLSFSCYQEELERLRYRNGDLNAYPSRLHYFIDWIYNNQEKGIIKDKGQEIGGVPYAKDINFMSTHRDSYVKLGDSDNFQAIINTEKAINARDYTYHYIPKGEISSFEEKINDGDLIAITTTIKGLDIVHVGLAYHQNERLHLLHASSKSNKVEISSIPIADYLAPNKIQSGIMVCRINNI